MICGINFKIPKNEKKESLDAKPMFSEIPETLLSHFCHAYPENQQDSNTIFTYDLTFEQQNYFIAKYQLRIAIRNLALNPRFIYNLYSAAAYWYQRTGSTDLPFYTLRKEDSTFALQIANELSTVMGNGCAGFNCIDQLESSMDVDGYKYELAISIYNIFEASNAYIQLVTPAIDVDDEMYYPNIDGDAVLGWAFNATNMAWEEVIIDENRSINCETMVIGIVSVNPGYHYVALGLSPPPWFYTGIKLPPPPPPSEIDNCVNCDMPPATAGDKFSTYDFRIKVRHERWGDSEVWNFGSRLAYSSFTGAWDHIPYPFAYSIFKKVNKNDINKWLYMWNEVADRPVNLQLRIDKCNTCWNSVERDWFEGKKAHCGTFLKLPNGTQIPIFSQSRRTWTNDYFAYKPEETPTIKFYDWICWHPSQWANNWINEPLGDFKMIRTQ
ncbi:hypothetical protein [Schleiferia thermophila]|uniref:hypothetical protein n=1 Tax=Schleiferia thermophila TaxID=884107 RepID=UPI002FD97FBE